MVDSKESTDPIRDIREFTDAYRMLVQHENDVTNHRMTWLLVSQGILVVAVTNMVQNEQGLLAIFVCVAAILITLSIGISLSDSFNARQSMKSRWRRQVRSEGLDPRDLPPLDGAYAEREPQEAQYPEREPPGKAPQLRTILFPWRFVPWVIGFFWGAVLVLLLFFPSTFSTTDGDLPDTGSSSPNAATGAPAPDRKDD